MAASEPLATPNDIYSFADLERQIETSPTAKRYFEAYAKAFPDQAAVLKEVRHFETTGTLTGTVPVWKLERFFRMHIMTGQADTFIYNFQHNIGTLYHRATEALWKKGNYQLLSSLLEQDDEGEILRMLLFRAGQRGDQEAFTHLHGSEDTRQHMCFLGGAAYGGRDHLLPVGQPNPLTLLYILVGAASGGRLEILKRYMPQFFEGTNKSDLHRATACMLVTEATRCATGAKTAAYLVRYLRFQWDDDDDVYKRAMHQAGILGAIGCPSKLDRFLTTVPPANMPRLHEMLEKAFQERDPEVFKKLLLHSDTQLDSNSAALLWSKMSYHAAFAAILAAHP